MAYRHPNEMKANQELLEKCMHDAVHTALNEVIPSAMEEMESVLDQKIEDLKASMPKAEGELTPPQHQDFTKGIYVGLGIGACLFIGLVTGLLVAQLL